MEQLNRIELSGTVGNAYFTDLGEKQVLRFTLVTNFAYRGKEGDVIEATWHNIVAWKSQKMPDLSTIGKGSRVHIVGRMRNDKYVDRNGSEVSQYIVAADWMEILKNEDSFVSQM